MAFNDPILTAICDSMADLDRVSADVLDWSVGASLGEAKLEFELTIEAESHRGPLTAPERSC